MKQYTKAELEILTLEEKDVLTLSSPIGSHDDPNDTDDTGYGGFGLGLLG